MFLGAVFLVIWNLTRGFGYRRFYGPSLVVVSNGLTVTVRVCPGCCESSWFRVLDVVGNEDEALRIYQIVSVSKYLKRLSLICALVCSSCIASRALETMDVYAASRITTS